MTRRVAIALCALVASGCGCSSGAPRKNAGAQCELNSECAAPLVCRLGRCRAECATSRDCAAGLSCVLDADGLGACQLPEERSCELDSDCPAPLVCRQVVLSGRPTTQCTNECGAAGPSADCTPGSVCREEPPGNFSCIDVGDTPCGYDSECAGIGEHVAFRCVDGRCREECVHDRDCRRGYTCWDATSEPAPPEPGARANGFCVEFDPTTGTPIYDGGPARAGDGGTTGDGGPGGDGGPDGDGGPGSDGGPPSCFAFPAQITIVLDGSTTITFELQDECMGLPEHLPGCSLFWFDLDSAVATGPITGDLSESTQPEPDEWWFHVVVRSDYTFPIGLECGEPVFDAYFMIGGRMYDLTGVLTELPDFTGPRVVIGSGSWVLRDGSASGSFEVYDVR